MNEIVDAQVVEEAPPLPVPAPPANLFHGSGPADVVKKATETANALKPVLTNQKLTVKIQGKDHITVEGWQTLGAMLGVTPVCTWTRKLDNGWEARVEARTLDGRVIGAAEAECLRDEKRWTDADDYAVRSMAQTRATSKALASVLRFVATLAGYDGTPAEEMPRDGRSAGPPKGFSSAKQKDYFERLLREADVSPEMRGRIIVWAESELTGERDGPISAAIDGLKADDPEMVPRLIDATEKWGAKQSDIPVDDTDLPPVAEIP